MAKEAEDFVAVDTEREVVDGLEGAELLGQVVKLNGCVRVLLGNNFVEIRRFVVVQPGGNHIVVPLSVILGASEAEAAALRNAVGVWHNLVKVEVEEVVEGNLEDEDSPGDEGVHVGNGVA